MANERNKHYYGRSAIEYENKKKKLKKNEQHLTAAAVRALGQTVYGVRNYIYL